MPALVAAETASMRLKRPHILMIERREAPEFSFEDLVAGGAGVVTRGRWIALAPHLDDEVEVEAADLAVLEAVSAGEGIARDALLARFDPARVEALCTAGLLIGDGESHACWRARDAELARIGWWAPAAVAHGFGRWSGVDVQADEQQHGRLTLARLIEEQGLPPTEVVAVGSPGARLPLPETQRDALDALLEQRSTCRNFIPGAGVTLGELATTLYRVFGAQAAQELAPGAVMLKKNSPSGGGLHPIDAYVLAQRVDGLASGLYHYDCVAHALQPMQSIDAAALAPLAHELVAGQAWFADAPVLVLLAARFHRNFWKYRRHVKAWKVVLLDAGHLSQNFYLSATALGLGAFVTGAINDRCAERLFELDGLGTGAIAVCGMGRRAVGTQTFEFDPRGVAPRG